MSLLLSAQGLVKSYGAKPLFVDLSIELETLSFYLAQGAR